MGRDVCNKHWPPEHKQFLIDNHETMSDVEIGRALGRKPSAVMGQRYNLGLKSWAQIQREETARLASEPPLQKSQISKDAAKASDLGMSYGEFIAMQYEKQMELEKAAMNWR